MARKARDGATYVRVQKGHSILLWILLSCCGIFDQMSGRSG